MRRSGAATVAMTMGMVLGIGCANPGGRRDVRATVLDEAGSPIPGAVFYAEAYDDRGPFAFLSARAGDAGEVPDSAREPLKISWRRGAHIALAAFAPGRRPAVLRDPDRRIESDGIVLVLLPRSADGGWNPVLRDLGFPFEGLPELEQEASGPEYAALRGAFREAWAAREKRPEPLTAAEKRKIAALSGPGG